MILIDHAYLLFIYFFLKENNYIFRMDTKFLQFNLRQYFYVYSADAGKLRIRRYLFELG